MAAAEHRRAGPGANLLGASSRAACATIPLARASHMPEPSISGAGEYTSSSYGGQRREENFVNNNLPRGAKLLVIEPSSHA